VDIGLVVGIASGVALVWVALLLLFWLLRPRGVSPGELIGAIPAVVRLIRSLIGDRTVPIDVRAVLVGLLVWILSPIDLIPEFIPVLGPLDDVVVAIVAMRYVRRRLGADELHRRWTGTDEAFEVVARVIGT
jgi:uncharacterized membrane protein YkvA (DUF1232 family)